MQKRRASISMPARLTQRAGVSRVIGLSGLVLVLRAFACQRKGWLEALGDEERLKLLGS